VDTIDEHITRRNHMKKAAIIVNSKTGTTSKYAKEISDYLKSKDPSAHSGGSSGRAIRFLLSSCPGLRIKISS
jgi:hypothetical protein